TNIRSDSSSKSKGSTWVPASRRAPTHFATSSLSRCALGRRRSLQRTARPFSVFSSIHHKLVDFFPDACGVRLVIQSREIDVDIQARTPQRRKEQFHRDAHIAG